MKCPGQDTRFWKPDAILEYNCPKCSAKVEFFKDDTARKCGKCGHKFPNPNIDFGCAAYCPYAEQCIGVTPDEIKDAMKDLLKDKVAVEMKKYFKTDFKRIAHAMKVARYAEQINKKEKGDLAAILCASYLHDIGILEAERKYNSAAPKYQELEGPQIALAILSKLNASEKLKSEVCDIIGHHHHPKKDETIEFKVLYDADRITNLEYSLKNKNMKKEKFLKIIEKQFLTETGKETARKVLL